MSTAVLAAEQITIGTHWEVQVFGYTLNMDTILATLVAGGVLIVLGLIVARRASPGVPNRLQLFFETVNDLITDQVRQNLGVRTAPWVIPLAMCLFLFILFANLLAILPTEHILPPPTADVNLTYALALLVIFAVWGTALKNRPRKFLAHFASPYKVMLPLNLIEELAKPVSLALRLFGNVLSGVIMIQLIGLLPAYLLWAPFTAWKLFDIFIGLLQAVIFTILTIIYFGQALGDEEEAH
ncbi:MAG: synthase subunit a [Pseudonocardia sp.]|nr:synthase subunit a [Pseudonocardia sp.]